MVLERFIGASLSLILPNSWNAQVDSDNEVKKVTRLKRATFGGNIFFKND